ncbi:MAG: hypothetical protein J7K40_12130 [candidate division Zixibacteria bacterium]|nr:hypothetical protein [candidate division Zixibacteria bacterium]
MKFNTIQMTAKPLDKRIDDILEVLYDASDVPYLHRKYLTTLIDGKDIENWINCAVNDYMYQRNDHTEDIRDLKDRIGKIEDAIGALTRAFKDV